MRTDHGNEAAGALARRLARCAGVAVRSAISIDLYQRQIGADPLAEVVAWALEHLHEQFDVETLAARAYMSRRTFDRRFRSLTGSAPLQWLITQRVLQAQRLLETSDYSVDEAAGRCGLRLPVALRGHFRRQLGSSPAAYRAAYRARRPQSERPSDVDGSAGQAGPSPVLNQESPVPLQTRRTAAATALGPSTSLSTEPGKTGTELYAAGRLPGQRSAP